MRHRVAGRKLGRKTAHRILLYRNLVTDLLNHEKLVTTEAKAKESRAIAEKVITLGKQGTLAARRKALEFVISKNVVDKVFDELAPRYSSRSGGYTTIVKLGPRVGDAAPLVQVELVP